MKASACLTLYNEEKGVKRMLNYIEKHSNLFDDLVIVSDNCHDRTEEIVDEWAGHHHTFKVSLFMRPKRLGRASAMRLCLKNSLNDVNIILAGDVEPIGNAFENILKYFDDSKVGAVTGHPVLLNGERTIPDILNHIMWTSHDRSRKILSDKGELYQLSGEILAIRKSALKGFDGYSGLVDDAIMGYLIKREGYKVLFAEDVTYFMLYPSDLKGYLKIRQRNCYGRIEFARKTGYKDNPYYELTHNEYLVNVLKATLFKPKYLLSLVLGIPVEVLYRIHYNYKRPDNLNPYDTLWQPAKGTKW